MTDDRQTFAIGETIRQKHLDAVARDATLNGEKKHG